MNNFLNRANKTWFYQSGMVVYIEFNALNQDHLKLRSILLKHKTPALKAKANRLAKKIGFKTYYNSDFGRRMLSEDLSVITCGTDGLITVIEHSWPY